MEESYYKNAIEAVKVKNMTLNNVAISSPSNLGYANKK